MLIEKTKPGADFKLLNLNNQDHDAAQAMIDDETFYCNGHFSKYLNFVSCFSTEQESPMRSQNEIVVMFDLSTNYLMVNKTACLALKRNPSSLLGKSILQLYPYLVASDCHRNLLKALGGTEVTDVLTVTRRGKILSSDYLPIGRKNVTVGALVKARYKY